MENRIFEIKDNGKALKDFRIELPMFTILTGENGSGKTQILRDIERQYNYNDSISSQFVNLSSSFYSDSGNSITDMEELIDSIWNIYNEYKVKYDDFKLKLDDEKEKLGKAKGALKENESLIPIFEMNIDAIEKEMPSLDENTEKYLTGLKKNLKEFNIEFDNITEAVFHCFFPLPQLKDSKNLFSSKVDDYIRSYLTRFKYNEKLKKDSIDNTVYKYLNQEDFEKLFGIEPWVKVNKTFEKVNLNFRIAIPQNKNFGKIRYKLFFEKIGVDRSLEFNDLSQGEAILISLVLSICDHENRQRLPNILLLDEPDAYLHPNFIKEFIRSIKEVFVEKLNIQIIMTTHSPTTVAIAEESCLFVINKTGKLIEKTTKEKALKILTTGLPYLNISYDNRRTVFVESDYDAINYDKLFNIYNDKIDSEVSLLFISSGKSKLDKHGYRIATCEQVKNIVKELNTNGNKLIRGIIDRDLSNYSNQNVEVLGNRGRYAIENYILDPILIAIYLVLKAYKPKDYIELAINENCFEIEKYKSDKLQEIIDKICDEIYLKSKAKIDILCNDFTKTKFKYLNDCECEIPNWYINIKGHELEKIIKSTFMELNEFQKENDFKMTIINEVITNCRGLIANEFVDTFKKLCI